MSPLLRRAIVSPTMARISRSSSPLGGLAFGIPIDANSASQAVLTDATPRSKSRVFMSILSFWRQSGWLVTPNESSLRRANKQMIAELQIRLFRLLPVADVTTSQDDGSLQTNWIRPAAALDW